MMDKLEMRPGHLHARSAALSETVGGGLLALGGLTPLAAAALSGTMFTAIRKVHFAKGLWNTGGGYEYNAVLIAALASLVECGPGSPSVDRALGIEMKGSKWALASVAAGAIGSAIAIERGRPAPEPTPPRPPQRVNGHKPERAEVAAPA
jgi:putative oxidoreductase